MQWCNSIGFLHEPVLQPRLLRARRHPRPHLHRLLRLCRPRVRPQVLPGKIKWQSANWCCQAPKYIFHLIQIYFISGQMHRELDIPEGRRGRVPEASRAGQEVRRSRRRHGLRRGRTGEH